MLIVLSFCHKDRDQAKKSLEWIEELGGGVNHELMLSWSMIVGRHGPPQDLIDIAKRAFKNVFEFPLFDEDERGHPMSANHAWLSCARQIENPNPKVLPSPQPWLWLEPDAVLLIKTGFDRIEAEYKLRDRPFMGDIIPANEARKVQRRPSGIGVYPWNTPYIGSGKVLYLDARAWDDFLAVDILPNHFQTPLIQDMYCMSRDPDVEPTFPDAVSLSIISKDAVLFHRCSDGTLIDRLREINTRQAIHFNPPAVHFSAPSELAAPITGIVKQTKIKSIHVHPVEDSIVYFKDGTTERVKSSNCMVPDNAYPSLMAGEEIARLRAELKMAQVALRMAKVRAARGKKAKA